MSDTRFIRWFIDEFPWQELDEYTLHNQRWTTGVITKVSTVTQGIAHSTRSTREWSRCWSHRPLNAGVNP